MRALLIGVGGAGCRIVEMLNLYDLRSGVNSVRSYVFDSDVESIYKISGIDRDHKIILTPIDPIKENNNKGTDFDVSNIVDCFKDYNVSNIDAVFVCAGLGGRMAEAVPSIIKQLKEAFSDPIFSILTLPGRNEGVKISARASQTLAEIRRFASASIIFDNETWSQKTESGNVDKAGLIKTKSVSDNYNVLNEILSRQVSLLFRAGEFTDKGVDSAEVVLDAGEVLNTLTGMDLVAMGFSLEKLPSSFSGFLKKFRLERYLLDEGHLKTSRIVDLAKKAVYEEVSVPCDLTSANKALVLISGPSEELSMKGFQTVRKWIDRSIRGIEMRAGDYPVKSTKYVGVIIVLAGIENIPRVTELNGIRKIYEDEQNKVYIEEDESEEIEQIDIPLLTTAEDNVIFERETFASRKPEPQEPVIEAVEEPADFFEDKESGEKGFDDFFEDSTVTANALKPEPEPEPVIDKTPAKSFEDDFFEPAKASISAKTPQPAEASDDFFEVEKPVYSREQQRYYEPERNPDYPREQQRYYEPERNPNYPREQQRYYEPGRNPDYPREQQRYYEPERNPNYPREQQRYYEPERNPNYPREQPRYYEPERNPNYQREQQRYYEPERNPDYPREQQRYYEPERNPNYPREQQRYYEPERNPNYPREQQRYYEPERNPNYPREQQRNPEPEYEPAHAEKVDDNISLPPKKSNDDIPKQDAPKYEKITIFAPKTSSKQDTVMYLPKREKKIDNVLNGMINAGGNDMPKETGSLSLSVGDRKRPKEAERTGLDCGTVLAGSSKRPKETDGFVKIAGSQRPKETDGFVKISSSQRPKETDGVIKVGSNQRPKETESGIPVEGSKKPKELNKPMRITNIPLPKNLDGKSPDKKN